MTQRPDFERMTEEELAAWQYEHQDELDAELDDAEEVEVEVSKPLKVTTSFRMEKNEASKIRQATKDAGMTQSEWIRRACLAQAEVEAAPESERSTIHLVWSKVPTNILRNAAIARVPELSKALSEFHKAVPEMEHMRAMLKHLSAVQENVETVMANSEHSTADR